MNKDLLYKLISTPSVSGDEITIQKLIMREMKPFVDTFQTHHSGNLISIHNPNSNFKILLSAHIDEIGLMVTNIEDNGLCKVTEVGSPNPYMYVGHQVLIKTKNGLINGVFANNVNSHENKLSFSDLLLDIGCYSKEETQKYISVGDFVFHNSNYYEMQNNTLSGRALDNKLGAYIILEVLKRVKTSPLGIYATTSVGEETTAHGATFAATNISPQMAIIVDVTHATDHNGRAKEKGYVALGGGPVLTLGTSINHNLLDLAKEVSKELEMPLQYEISPERTYTDTDKIHFLEKGIPSILISIPLRYMHSSVEVCKLDDVEMITDLITNMILKIDDNFNFDPFK